jgi:hypothetical protein
MTKEEEMRPEDVIKMSLCEFTNRFGFSPADAREKKWFAVTGKRLTDDMRAAIEAGVIGDDNLDDVVMV